jgi:hypothetical protein
MFPQKKKLLPGFHVRIADPFRIYTFQIPCYNAGNYGKERKDLTQETMLKKGRHEAIKKLPLRTTAACGVPTRTLGSCLKNPEPI